MRLGYSNIEEPRRKEGGKMKLNVGWFREEMCINNYRIRKMEVRWKNAKIE